MRSRQRRKKNEIWINAKTISSPLAVVVPLKAQAKEVRTLFAGRAAVGCERYRAEAAAGRQAEQARYGMNLPERLGVRFRAKWMPDMSSVPDTLLEEQR